MTEPDRRLLAIVCADVAGYSRMMSADEEGTFLRLQAFFRDTVHPAAARHQGRIVKTMGDGFLAEFGSAVKALTFASEVVRQAGRAGAGFDLRTGVHVGDVIADGDDVFGDGVNIAARLQALAEPGRILVSRAVRDHAREHFAFREAGERRLKNMPRPVRTFYIDTAASRSASRIGAGRAGRGRFWLAGAAALLVALVAVSALVAGWWGQGEMASRSVRPSLAVMPFVNRSGDASQDYFSDGLTDNLVTALTRFPNLFVVSRNSSFAYKGKPIDLGDVARTLGVRYVLEGSVQKDAGQLRVTAQLSDGRTGAQIWADRYDRPLKDLFAIQDEIAGNIASKLGSSIQRAEVAASLSKPPTDLTSYDYYLQGRSLRQTNRKEQALEARSLFEKAIALDPGFAPALAELAFAYYRQVALRWDPPNREADLATGLGYADRALSADPGLPMAHMAMGDLLLRKGLHDEAARWARRALELNPNDAEYHAGLANILSFRGEAAEAITLMERAFLLDPLHPPNYDMYLGRALLLARRYAEALPHLRDCSRRAVDYWPCHLFSAVTFAFLGQSEAAAAALDQLYRHSPIRTARDFLISGEYLPSAARDVLEEGMRKAGLPSG